MTTWNHETDLVVVGSGGGGMVAALTAKLEGLDSLVIEKTEYYGGTTAISGGGMWIPNNHLMAEAGIEDSFEKARVYMQHTVGDRTPQSLQDAFLINAPKMVSYLSRMPHLVFQITPGFSDYYPDRPGATIGGRSIEMPIYDGKKLGKELLSQLRPRPIELPFGFICTIDEIRKIVLLSAYPLYLLELFGPFARNLYSLLTGIKQLGGGPALISRLRKTLYENDIPVWLNSPVKEFVFEGDSVVGVVVEKDGKRIRVRASKGVVLAAGGFPHNQAMREKYQKHPVSTEWTGASPGNTGEIIEMGIAAGADSDLMDENWGMPSMTPPGLAVYPLVVERSYPGGIMVNSAGRRFTNESASYVDVAREMRESNSDSAISVPSYFIFDHHYRNRHILGTQIPVVTPKKYFDSGFLQKADTLVELAEKIGVDSQGLIETVARNNEFARTGKDLDFGRGDSAYDRFYSYPAKTPNCCLGSIEKPPFYAFKVFPGDIGTKGGLVTNANAQVLNKAGSVIEGLYAIGNTSASVMGTTYPGGGSTIGPAMTFGYVAAMHAAGKLSKE